jgi:hypothetical protein
MVSDDRLRIETEEQRDRLHAARREARICAACGRRLRVGETVYLEGFAVVRSVLMGPVGRECASPELLALTKGMEPERCVTCGRGVYYRVEHQARRQATCSRLCAGRAAAARHRAKEGRA